MGHWLIDPPLCGNFKRENDVLHSKPLFLWGCTILQITWDFVGYIILRGQTWHMFGMKPITMVQPAEKGYQWLKLLSSSEDRDLNLSSKHENFTIKLLGFNMVQPTKTHAYPAYPCAKHKSDFISTMSMYNLWSEPATSWGSGTTGRVLSVGCRRLRDGPNWLPSHKGFCHGGCPNFWLYSRHGNHYASLIMGLMGLMIKLMINGTFH